ncbi:MAG TPA: hypothetical protein VIW24_04905 [Aldersonia sp.]
MNEQEYRERMGRRLTEYIRLRDEFGDKQAREELLDGYVELQAKRMGPLMTTGLADGFRKVRPAFAAAGVHIEIIDASTDGVDSAVEILTTCECRATCEAVGTSEPLSVLCELDNEAARRAFPGMTVEVVRQQIRGAHVCVFRYSRDRAGLEEPLR